MPPEVESIRVDMILNSSSGSSDYIMSSTTDKNN